MARREFDRHYKSLLHFDFPYYAEPGDGCRDEINIISWKRVGNIKFAGVEIPNDEVFAPKFGYRCMHSTGAGTYLSGTGGTEIFNLSCKKRYTIEFFINAQGAGDIFALYSGNNKIFAISLNSSNQITITGGSVPANHAALTLNSWQHAAINIYNGMIRTFVNGTMLSNVRFSDFLDGVNEVRLGGFNGYLDEFLFTTGAEENIIIPTEPHKGILDIESIGGYGDGRHGIGEFTAKNNNLRINTVAGVKKIIDSSTFIIYHHHAHTHGGITEGDELFIIVKYKTAGNFQDLGLYAFRHVKNITGTTITLDSPITEFAFTPEELNNYCIHVYKVPNYEKFTLGENVILKPRIHTADAKICPEGLIIFRVKGDCTINGKIITHGTNASFPRQDNLQMTNSDLLDRFLCNTNGGVIIICGGKFTAGENARIGGDYPGNSKGGIPALKSVGGPGGSGYGGAGGSDCDNNGVGGVGGVGGAGGGGDYYAKAGDAGSENNTGGHGSLNTKKISGGTQGKTTGGAGLNGSYPNCSGGGGALGNGGNYESSIKGGQAGANVMIICDTLNCDLAAISTGGEGGKTGYLATGGGGSGMCYIACRQML